MPRRITVGVPVYQGVDQVGKACSLQPQTFTDLDVVISVDANDQESPGHATVSRRRTIPPDGSCGTARLARQLQLAAVRPLGEFFCYRQHDDTTAPEFFGYW